MKELLPLFTLFSLKSFIAVDCVPTKRVGLVQGGPHHHLIQN
jgi:hypothetical protein